MQLLGRLEIKSKEKIKELQRQELNQEKQKKRRNKINKTKRVR